MDGGIDGKEQILKIFPVDRLSLVSSRELLVAPRQ